MKVKFDNEMKVVVAAAVTHTSLDAKRFAVVDHSGLKNSIHSVTNMDKGLTGEVVVGVSYGPYIEFGTGSKVVVPGELKNYAMQFKGAGFTGRLPVFIGKVGWRMVQFPINLPARPYLYPAFFINREKFIKACDAILKKIL
jgi:hypothetical protein